MEAAKQSLLAKGGTLGDWTGLITNGLQPEDLAWVDAATHPGNVLDYARRVMNRDGIMEYECYDARGRAQGKAIIRLLDWDDYALGTLRGVHLRASDPYYDWYAQHELQEGKGIYHLCGSKRSQCTARLGRGDRREMVHLERWRMTNPMVMLEHDYSKEVALMAVNNWVSNFAAKVPEPPNPPGPPGGARGADPTGLDKALAEAGEAEEEDQVEKRKKNEGGRPEVHPKGLVGLMLERKAAERRAALADKERQDQRRRPDRGRSRSRGRRRRRRKRSSSPGEKGHERSDSSGSSRSFREPSTRGEVEMWRQSRENPGALLKKGMEEMARYLAERAPGEEGGTDTWMSHQMMAYVSQVVLTQHLPGTIGVRNHRELLTLGRAIDMLIQGQLGELGDLLMQRLKAVETSLVDQGWHSAKHQELISPHAASLTTEAERRRTARMEISANKLKEMTLKGRKGDK